MYDFFEKSGGLRAVTVKARNIQNRDAERHAKRQSRHRGLRVEWLEDRTLLDGNLGAEVQFAPIISDGSNVAQFVSTLAINGITPSYSSSYSGMTPGRFDRRMGSVRSVLAPSSATVPARRSPSSTLMTIRRLPATCTHSTFSSVLRTRPVF